MQSYKKLRTEDAAPGSSTAYRITVRQLEALVRLSEAIARAACNPHILPEYVQEVSALRPHQVLQCAWHCWIVLQPSNDS